jgi:hypothetical protein
VQYVLQIQGEKEEHGEHARSDEEHAYVRRDQCATPKQPRWHQWVTASQLQDHEGPKQEACDGEYADGARRSPTPVVCAYEPEDQGD